MNNRAGGQPHVYVSGALSGLSGQELARVIVIYDQIARAAEESALGAYLPHRSPTAPGSKMEPSAVWRTDFLMVTEAELVVAYIGVPSLGVGSEIEMARAANVPVILVCETDRLAHVSRLALGSPAVERVLAFENPAQLDQLLMDTFRSVQTWRLPLESPSSLKQLANDVFTSAKEKASHKPSRAERHRPGPTSRVSSRLG